MSDACVDRWQQNGLYFAAKQLPLDTLKRWLVWCSFSPLVADNPIREPKHSTVWFESDTDREAAISKLLKEVYSGDEH